MYVQVHNMQVWLDAWTYNRGTANSLEYPLEYSFGILKNSVPNGKRCSDFRSALTGRHRKTPGGIEKRKQYGEYTELVLLLNIFWGKETLFGIRYSLD